MPHQFQQQTQERPPSEVQFQALREELDTANKKVDRYVRLVATLCEELDNLRRGICHTCRQKFIPSYASSLGGPHPSSGCHTISGHQTQSSSSVPPVFPPDARESITTPIPVHPVTTLPRNQAKTPSISPPPPAPQPSATQRQPPVDEMQSNQPDWAVVHNSEIKQGLHIDPVKTFNLTTVVFCLKFSPDGKYLAVGDNSGKTYIYDVERGLNICHLADYSLRVQPNRVIWNVQFSPDSQYVATAESDGRIRIWEIARKRTISMFRRLGSIVYSISFSPGGRFLVSSDASGAICKWRIRDGFLKILLQRGSDLCVSVGFSPNGLYIASVHFHGDLRIWDARTNQLVHEWRGHTGPPHCLAFTPDGKGLVSGGDKTLKYWDTSSLVHAQSGQRLVIDGRKFEQIRRFVGRAQAIRSVAICPDNQFVASSQDRSVRIWDTGTATWQCSIQGHTKPVMAVDFSPAGSYLASGSWGGQVRLWRYRRS